MDVIDFDTIRAIGLVRGALIHLVRLGEGVTLCGRKTGMNPNYLPERFGYTSHPSHATCGNCKAILGVEIPAEVLTVKDYEAKIARAEASIARLGDEMRLSSNFRRRSSLKAMQDETRETLDKLKAELSAAVQDEANR
jgi:hypothetical protein